MLNARGFLVVAGLAVCVSCTNGHSGGPANSGGAGGSSASGGAGGGGSGGSTGSGGASGGGAGSEDAGMSYPCVGFPAATGGLGSGGSASGGAQGGAGGLPDGMPGSGGSWERVAPLCVVGQTYCNITTNPSGFASQDSCDTLPATCAGSPTCACVCANGACCYGRFGPISCVDAGGLLTVICGGI